MSLQPYFKGIVTNKILSLYQFGVSLKLAHLADFVAHLIVLCTKKQNDLYSKNILEKSSRNNFFFTCNLPDYMSHESLKEFWKNYHFENMRATFLRRCQNSLRQTSHEMMHFQARKTNILK